MEDMMSDDLKLERMWIQQREFMELLQKKRNFPQFPVDISSKDGQKFLKNIAHECMGELYEAVTELKNHKEHRVTEITELNRDAYIEELVDATHYLFEIIIASGVTLNEFYEAYMKKGHTNSKRINDGY